MIIADCQPTAAKTHIRKHHNIITVAIAGPMEYNVIITKIEANELIDAAETSGFNIDLFLKNEELTIRIHDEIAPNLGTRYA